jgi:hypothetical protein
LGFGAALKILKLASLISEFSWGRISIDRRSKNDLLLPSMIPLKRVTFINANDNFALVAANDNFVVADRQAA